MMKGRVRQSGFTIVELLVASVIMVVILGALGSLFLSTSKAYRVNDEVSTLQQSADAAGQLLTYEIGLAGYRGSNNQDLDGNGKGEVDERAFTESTLTITKVASPTASDKITVRYFEDRFADTVEQLVITLDAVETNSKHNLYRKLEKQSLIGTTGYAPNRQSTVEDVHNLKVLKYVRTDGSETTTPPSDAELAGLRLEFTLVIDDKTTKQQVVVGLKNPQNAPFLPPL